MRLSRALLVLALVATGCVDWDGLYSDEATGMPLYRLHNTSLDCQIVTPGLDEVMTATESPKWTSDGVIAHIPALPLSKMAQIYRVDKPPGVDWFFTDDMAERDNAVATLGYVATGTGIGFSVALAQEPPRLPMYRLSKAGVHHYAVGDDERDAEVGAGWTLERTLGFVNP